MPLWNGRFKTRLDPRALRFSSSLKFDRRLFREDIAGSIAHVAMLARKKIVSPSDAKTIQRGLRQISREIESGRLALDATQRFDLTCRFGRNQGGMRIGPGFYAPERLGHPLIVGIHNDSPQMILR